MIIDAIISFFVSLFSVVVEGFWLLFVPLLNLIAGFIELIVGIFVSGFTMGRIERKKGKPKSSASTVSGMVVSVFLVGAIGWLVVSPRIMNRTVTLVAEDGHSLPYAAMVIHTEDGDLHRRTDKAGNIKIPRFDTTAVTVKDPRYVEKRWEKAVIEPELVVDRTVLGSSLDVFADKLLKPAKE